MLTGDRVLLIGSPWHAVLAKAAHRPGDRYIIERVSSQSYRGIVAVLGLEDIILEVKSEDMYFSSYLSLAQFFRFDILVTNVNRLVKFTRSLAIERLVIFSDENEISRIVINSRSWDEVVKMEDGVCDYLSIPLRPRKNWFLRALRYFALSSLGVQRYYNDVIFRLNEVLLFRPEKSLKYARARELKLRSCAIKDLLIGLHGGNEFQLKGDSVLIIGQTLYEDRSLSLSDEIEMYRCVINSASQYWVGAEKIYFKPHPRSSSEKLECLSEFAGADSGVEIIDCDLPVEAMIVAFNFKSVVGMWSNPILLGRWLFGTETFTMMHHLSETAMKKHLLMIHRNLIEAFSDDYIDYRQFAGRPASSINLGGIDVGG